MPDLPPLLPPLPARTQSNMNTEGLVHVVTSHLALATCLWIHPRLVYVHVWWQQGLNLGSLKCPHKEATSYASCTGNAGKWTCLLPMMHTVPPVASTPSP